MENSNLDNISKKNKQFELFSSSLDTSSNLPFSNNLKVKIFINIIMAQEARSRLTFDEMFKNILLATAHRSPCHRLQVGCVLVKDKRIISLRVTMVFYLVRHINPLYETIMNKQQSTQNKMLFVIAQNEGLVARELQLILHIILVLFVRVYY